MIETIYVAGGCLWGVQAFMKTLKGVVHTEAGRVNGTSNRLDSEYDGYAECVKTDFDTDITTVSQLMECFFEIIDPYSINKQGIDVGAKYRTGIYSILPSHLEETKKYIQNRSDSEKVVVEVLPMTNYVKSAEEHQDRLDKFPNDYCHISKALLNKYT